MWEQKLPEASFTKKHIITIPGLKLSKTYHTIQLHQYLMSRYDTFVKPNP